MKVMKEKQQEAGKNEEDVIELDANGGGFDISKPSSPHTEETVVGEDKKSAQEAIPVKAEIKAPDSENGANEDEDEDDSSGPPPIGNGSTIPGKYTWTKTLQELCITVPLPNNSRAKDLTVVISKNHLKIGFKAGDKLIVDDALSKSIIVDDSFWTVEDNGSRLVITL